MSARIDIACQRFGRLIAVRYDHTNTDNKAVWLCECDCGDMCYVAAKSLRSGNTKSCGCYRHDRQIESATKHNGCGTRLHRIWSTMKTRCYNPNNHRYKWYGAKGITVCDEWLHDFSAFRDWALSNGYTDDLTIDRVDEAKGYEPSNCRWIPHSENSRKANNKRWHK